MEPRITETGTLTTTMLILIAIFAVVTIAGILWGMRLKRARSEAKAIEAERVAEEGEAPIAEPETPPAPPPPPPLPVAPSPPLIVKIPIAATPDPLPTPVEEPPIAPAATVEAAPADPAPAPVHEPVAPAGPDPADGPLTQLKGLGPKVAAMLAEHGITTVGDIAALDAARAEALDARLGAFTGRMARDRWIEQARFLAAGDKAGFEAVFGKL